MIVIYMKNRYLIGEKAWGAFARGFQLFMEFTNRNNGNLNSFCKK
jgi:hypothetical protein